ncbi:MAG: SIS domain-containing protein, partial [Candidatus Sulfotelmatobacter sp.]
MSSRGLDKQSFAQQFLAEATSIIAKLDLASIEKAAALIASTRAIGGRLFILGVGGSAANASHAVNDFRKIAGIEAYAPTDNVSELTARANDEGWSSIFDSWLRTSRLRSDDLLLIFSVGGGNVAQNVSPNLVAALQYAKTVGAKIIGVVGRDGGYTATVADACVLIPTVNPAHITPHAEAFQAVVWHLLVSHPAVKMQSTKWESMASAGKQRAVFLDRDGVINRAFVREGKPFPPPTPQELEILPGVPEALRELKSHGFELLVVTNQPDVGRGKQSREVLDAMHQG